MGYDRQRHCTIENAPCIDPTLAMMRCIDDCGLMAFPRRGHAINPEEPDLFNRAVLDFLTAVEQHGG